MPQPILPLVLLPSPKDAFRAVKKRIVGNKNFHEVMLALTVSAPSLHPRWDHSPLGAQQDSQPPWGSSFKGRGQSTVLSTRLANEEWQERLFGKVLSNLPVQRADTLRPTSLKGPSWDAWAEDLPVTQKLSAPRPLGGSTQVGFQLALGLIGPAKRT